MNIASVSSSISRAAAPASRTTAKEVVPMEIVPLASPGQSAPPQRGDVIADGMSRMQAMRARFSDTTPMPAASPSREIVQQAIQNYKQMHAKLSTDPERISVVA